MAKRNKEKQPKKETLDRHYDFEGHEKYKKEGQGIPGRES